MTRSKFHTEKQHVSGAAAQHLVATATWICTPLGQYQVARLGFASSSLWARQYQRNAIDTHILSTHTGCAMAQAQIRSQDSLCGICSGQSGIGTGFSAGTCILPVSIHFHSRTDHERPDGGEETKLYSFFNLGARWGWVVNAALPPRKDPAPTVQEVGCAGVDGCGKFRPHRNSILAPSSP